MVAAAVVALLALGLSLDRGLVGRPTPSAAMPATSTSPAVAPRHPAPLPTPLPATRAPSAGVAPLVPLAPRIVADHLTFGATRRAETAAYAQRHYGTRTSRLDPTMIVLHYTESDTYASARSLFEADQPNRGERPGTCAHYVIDQDGTVHELVPPTLICRHTVGLNDQAIGIEFVHSSKGHGSRWAVQQILGRKGQAAAGVALVEDLQRRFQIADGEVIGHAMANDSNGFHDLRGWRNDHTDWQRPEVATFRRMLTTAP